MTVSGAAGARLIVIVTPGSAPPEVSMTEPMTRDRSAWAQPVAGTASNNPTTSALIAMPIRVSARNGTDDRCRISAQNVTRRPVWELLAVLAVAALLYFPGLDTAPPYLASDEAFFAVQAHSIATTGRDADGRFLPLYFQIRPNEWFQPTIVYFTSLFLRVLPLSQWAVRLPTVLIGLLEIALIYLIARRLFPSTPLRASPSTPLTASTRHRLAIVAAALLMLTPGHFLLSRIAMDFLYPVPFTLAWLLCFIIFLQQPRPLAIGAATAFLGFGFFSYLASAVMMPLYFAITLLMFLLTPATRRVRYVAAALAGFLLPMTLLLWLVRHPEVVGETFIRYRLYEQSHTATTLTPLSGLWLGVRSFLHLEPIAGRVGLYWTFFSPSYLFLTGGANMLVSTGRPASFC
jgi:4-amino-4-deoxy-L-arabinose transferase-like glycosyltransferase